MRGLINLVLIAILSLLISQSVYSQNSCRALFDTSDLQSTSIITDSRYGKLSQNNLEFYKKGLISNNKSMLCGPVCVHNALKKFETVLDTSITSKDEVQSVLQITQVFEKHLGVTLHEITQSGVSDIDISAAIDKFLVQRKIPHEVKLLVASQDVASYKANLRFEDLAESVDINTAVIALIHSYDTPSADSVQPKNFKYGHYVLVNGYNQADFAIHVADPNQPELSKQWQLKPIRPKSFAGDTFEIVSQQKTNLTHVISSLIKINLGKTNDYLKSAVNKKSLENYNKDVDSISTADQLITFIDRIKDMYGKTLDKSWGSVLQGTDLVSVLLKIKQQAPNDPQLLNLKWLLEKMNFSEDIAISSGAELSGWTYPLLLTLVPSRINELFHDLAKISQKDGSFQSLASAQDGLSFFNASFIQFINQLSPANKKRLLESINYEFSKIDLNEESLSVQNNQMVQPQSRVHRRNLEVLLKVLMKDELTLLTKDLALNRNSPSFEKTAIINRYFRALTNSLGKKRGNYNFKLVLDSAVIIRRYFFKYLDQQNSYVEMYGSFANGKANFKTSDVDIKLSESLFYNVFNKTYKQAKNEKFYLYLKDYIAENQDHPRLKDFWETFKGAEKALAENIFQRQPQHPSELLAMLYPVTAFSENPLDARWYNPITLRVYKDRIELHISDLMSTKIPLVISF